MFWLLRRTFQYIVKTGNLTIEDCRGNVETFGDNSGKPVVIELKDTAIERGLVFNPKMAVGEGFMEERLIVRQGTIYDFLELMLSNLRNREWPKWMTVTNRYRFLARRLHQFNPANISLRNIQHHYDVDFEIYRLFLDSDLNYSCAYFEQPDQTLEDAQTAKKRHLASKLDIQPGQTVLDIGSGWGGLAIYIALHFDVKVKGVTLSKEQLKIANERVNALGLTDRVQFELQDYRHIPEKFDRVISVGMFEHVGVGHFQTYVEKIRDLLQPDGVALVHSIGRFDGPGATNPFIAKYIFPGGYIPALSEVVPVIEESRLLITDIEIWRLHYAETLKVWRERFMASRDKASEIMDERFCRMWEFYLAGSEVAFRYDDFMVFQIQLCRDQESTPLMRDYMYETERDLRQSDDQR